jgi:hypothetical protein
MTDEGLRNLWCMNDAAAQEDHFHHVGRVDWDILRSSRTASSSRPRAWPLWSTRASCVTICPPSISTLKSSATTSTWSCPPTRHQSEFFDKDVDDPISPESLNKRIVEIAHERGIGLVYGDDGHYAFPISTRLTTCTWQKAWATRSLRRSKIARCGTLKVRCASRPKMRYARPCRTYLTAQ